jgi:uncharacterized protein (DUF885 family)
MTSNSCTHNENRTASEVRDLSSIRDAWWDFFQRENPETATALGEYKYNDRLGDISLQHVPRVRKEASDLLARLKVLDAGLLSASDQLDVTLLIHALQDQISGIDLKTWEMPVDQFNGIQIILPQLATFSPFDTVRHYDDYIARLKRVPAQLDAATGVLSQGEKDRLMPPGYLLEKTVAQCRDMATPAGEANPFAGPATRIPAGFSAQDKKRIHDEIIDIVNGQIRPAYIRFGKFLASDYAPKGRKEPGIWSLPDGDALYRFAVHQLTTSSKTPEEIHEIGLKQVTDLESQITDLAGKAGYPDGKHFLKAVMSDPKWMAKSREQILDNYRRYTGQMEAKLPQLFGRLPKAKLIVASLPEYMEKDGATEYIPGPADGSRPAQIWVRTYDPTHHSMLDDEPTAYHEGVPGHHMQMALAMELPNLHPFHHGMYFSAFMEGWALYAEKLGKEVGFYQEPASDLARLRSELFRAIRLVVDTGVHYKRWSRQQMVDYFREHYDEVPDAEIDRYIAWPAQALGYKLGQLEILELRQRAKTELGAKFDIRAFNDQVIGAGTIPLDVLEQRINVWLQHARAGS